MIGSLVGNTLAMFMAAVLAVAFPIGGSIMDAVLLPMAAIVSPMLFLGS
ncbi:hypothetical protein AB0M22_39435 [Nocardia sp. NPDC051756]